MVKTTIALLNTIYKGNIKSTVTLRYVLRILTHFRKFVY